MPNELTNLSQTLAETVERASAGVFAVHARRGPGSSGVAWRDNLVLTSAEIHG